MKDTHQISKTVARLLSDKKAQDVISLDLREVAPFIADFFIVATALTTDHARSLADHVEELLSQNGIGLHHQEGYSSGRWILLDAGDLVVHIMIRQAREFYALESLWADARLEVYEDTESA